MPRSAFPRSAQAPNRNEIGSPVGKTAVLHLVNGRTLTIEAKDQSDKNVYVKKVVLNGKTLKQTYLTYADITGGGKLVSYVAAKTNR